MIKPLSLFCVFIKVYLWMHKRAQEFNSCHVSPISVAPTISTGFFFFFNPELFDASKKIFFIIINNTSLYCINVSKFSFHMKRTVLLVGIYNVRTLTKTLKRDVK